MKKDCEVVRDLMPLVLDDVASDGSKHMVSAHVQTCAECAAYMNQLKADLPAGKKSELDSRAAFDAAAQTLRKQKRRRTLRNVLLGALIVCILGLANLYCFDWLMNETRPIPTSEYGIQLSQLADGRLVASFDYHESTTPLYVKRQQVTETAADESRAEILYLCAEKHIVPHTASTPMQTPASRSTPTGRRRMRKSGRARRRIIRCCGGRGMRMRRFRQRRQSWKHITHGKRCWHSFGRSTRKARTEKRASPA